jgi:hypothetical protein
MPLSVRHISFVTSTQLLKPYFPPKITLPEISFSAKLKQGLQHPKVAHGVAWKNLQRK